MRRSRRIGSLLAVAVVLLAAACGGQSIRRSTADRAPSRGGDLIVLLPDPDSGNVGRATVSNASGTADLDRARAATYVAKNAAPSPVTTLSESAAVQAVGGVFDALPPAAQHFILKFQFDSDELTPESKALLPDILRTVKSRPVPDVLVIGHTDTSGPSGANIALGLRRAAQIRKLLVETGLDASLIEIGSHGEADLVIPTPDGVAEPRNRRVEISVK